MVTLWALGVNLGVGWGQFVGIPELLRSALKITLGVPWVYYRGTLGVLKGHFGVTLEITFWVPWGSLSGYIEVS